VILPADDLWLYQQFADGSAKYKFLSAYWSPYDGWKFINDKREPADQSEQELKNLCAIAAQGLPHDDIRESWAVYLDRVREYDSTKKEAARRTGHIRQGCIAADRKGVEDRQGHGAVPAQITYLPYVRIVEAPIDQEALTELRASFMEQLLEERDGPMYQYTFNTVRIDDIFGACAVHLLHLMAAKSDQAVVDEQSTEARRGPGHPRATPNRHPEVEPFLKRVSKAAERRITIRDFCRVTGHGDDDTYFGFWRRGDDRCPERHAKRFERALNLSPEEFLQRLKSSNP
jgi:hypothetical protein